MTAASIVTFRPVFTAMLWVKLGSEERKVVKIREIEVSRMVQEGDELGAELCQLRALFPRSQ